jgi:hypothetical protein
MTSEEVIIERYKTRIGNRQLLAIRAHCVECFGGQPQAVAGCPSRSCALWPWRMGTGNPAGLEWHEANSQLNEKRGFWAAKTQSIADDGNRVADLRAKEGSA